MTKVFQITEQDLDCRSTLEPSDIGKWCYELNGCYQGFHDTREAAQSAADQLDEPYVPNLGWIGTKQALQNYLRVVGADQTDDGLFVISGDIHVFMGIDIGPQTELTIGNDVVYYVDGEPAQLAAGLRSTSSGIGIYVI